MSDRPVLTEGMPESGDALIESRPPDSPLIQNGFLLPLVEQIPQTLRARRRWAPWELVPNPAKLKPDKVPRVPSDISKGASTKGRWWPFREALLGWTELQGIVEGGLGFLMTDVEGIVGIDLDGCVSATGEIEPWAMEIIRRSGSYAELSPLGRGVRVLLLGSISRDWTAPKDPSRHVEAYGGHSARYLTLTGHRLDGSPADLMTPPGGFIDWFEAEYRPEKSKDKDRLPERSIPDLVSEGELPHLEDLRLPHHARAFLEEGEIGQHGDGSRSLFAATISLYEATAGKDGQLDDAVVLSMLYFNPHAWELALRHRRDDEGRALDYLWRHHCQLARAKAQPVVFDDLSGRKARRFYQASELQGLPIPKREWIVEGLIPRGTVTLLGGDGGTGKSLIALQAACAVATGRKWFGKEVVQGHAVFISAEDDDDELHRRLSDIASAEFSALSGYVNLTLHSLVDEDALLVTLDGSRGTLLETNLLREIDHVMTERYPVLLILDTLADLFPGNENDRAQVRQFIGKLRGLAHRHDCAVVLLAHPSLSGMTTGSGTSGSTGWSNSVRSRLYLDRIASSGKEADPDVRRLVVKKSNYSRIGLEITLRWQNGVFVAETGASADLVDQKAEQVFVKLLRMFAEQGRYVSASPSNTYAPKVFESHPEAEGISKTALAKAMNNLFTRNAIVNGSHGRGSKSRSHVELAPDLMEKDR